MSTGADALMLDALRRMFRRDIAALRREVDAYPDDASLWQLVPGIANSGGTLALHIAGNLRHFIGAALGNSGYVRNRDEEFSARNAARAYVVEQLADAEHTVDRVLRDFDASRLADEFPAPLPADMRARIGPFLMHLAVHLGYHLGQVDYHRRMVTGSPETVGTLAMPPVFSGEPLDA
jgi:uncharacterized damage-inducible protein DinB